MACCGYKPEEGHNGSCTFYGEEVQAILAACSRKPHSKEPDAAWNANALLREIERIVYRAVDRSPRHDPAASRTRTGG
jgi:hypothetical protein